MAVAPGCSFQAENARTTGAPIFFALSELDDYTPIGRCIEYRDRIRQAGNAQARLAVYPGVYHAQTRRGLENVKAILETGGVAMDDVVSTTVFMSDINEFQRMNETYAT